MQNLPGLDFPFSMIGIDVDPFCRRDIDIDIFIDIINGKPQVDARARKGRAPRPSVLWRIANFSPRNCRAAQPMFNRFSAGDPHPESSRTKDLSFSCRRQPGA